MCDTLNVMISMLFERLSPLRRENSRTDTHTHTHSFLGGLGLDRASLGSGSFLREAIKQVLICVCMCALALLFNHSRAP